MVETPRSITKDLPPLPQPGRVTTHGLDLVSDAFLADLLLTHVRTVLAPQTLLDALVTEAIARLRGERGPRETEELA